MTDPAELVSVTAKVVVAVERDDVAETPGRVVESVKGRLALSFVEAMVLGPSPADVGVVTSNVIEVCIVEPEALVVGYVTTVVDRDDVCLLPVVDGFSSFVGVIVVLSGSISMVRPGPSAQKDVPLDSEDLSATSDFVELLVLKGAVTLAKGAVEVAIAVELPLERVFGVTLAFGSVFEVGIDAPGREEDVGLKVDPYPGGTPVGTIISIANLGDKDLRTNIGMIGARLNIPELSHTHPP